MKLTAISFTLAATAAVVLADQLDADDVPSACVDVCRPIVTLTSICEIDAELANADAVGQQKRDDDDAEDIAERNCVCNNRSFNVADVMGMCASCLSQNGEDTDDVRDLMRDCNFTPRSFVPGATSVVSGIRVEATKPVIAGAGPSTSTPTGDANDGGRYAVITAAVCFGLGTIAMFLL
ncbi:Protein CAP22 [Paramyrothecium foliicola]|nr:Protein CAP22 [Paramyrothecium foliicola]